MDGMEESDKASDSPPSFPTSPKAHDDPTMAPNPTRNRVAKDRFPALYSTLKTQTYYDSSSRGSHK